MFRHTFILLLLTASLSGCLKVTGLWYEDLDGDGFGNPTVISDDVLQPDGYVKNNQDCNDLNRWANPNAAEFIGNGVDDDCNPATDDGVLAPSQAPTANATINYQDPTHFLLDASSSSDPDQPLEGVVSYEWDLDGDGLFDGAADITRYKPNAFELSTLAVTAQFVTLRVTDTTGLSDTLTLALPQCDISICNDSNLCTVDNCDPITGCSFTHLDCDDGNPCTIDGCTSIAGCFNTPAQNGLSCDDGNPNTTLDMCNNGICLGQPL